MTKFRKRIGEKGAEKIFKLSLTVNAAEITADEMKQVIGHLKSDHRMMRNYLKGTIGDGINTLMAAAAYNMRHWMNKNALSSFVSWLKTLVVCLEDVLFGSVNKNACLCPVLATVV